MKKLIILSLLLTGCAVPTKSKLNIYYDETLQVVCFSDNQTGMDCFTYKEVGVE